MKLNREPLKASEVIAGRERWSVDCSDAIDWLKALPDDSVDLLITSPPYEAARTYSIGFNLRGQDWVDWMMAVITAAAPKVRGLMAFNCEGQTEDYRYSCVPFLLMADLHRAGFNLRKPVVYHRNGIPGGGGPDWLRNDWEPVICITRPGRLPWSDNTACGHPPKWAPGGEMSHRVPDGKRVNQWGSCATNRTSQRKPDGTKRPGGRPGHVVLTKREQMQELMAAGMSQREAARQVGLPLKITISGVNDNGTITTATYVPPILANPGNVLKLLAGGGHMGHGLAHDNEAPFPVELPAFFVRSFCPPDGIVADCFAGSGSTLDAAIQNGRRGIGCDIRDSQVRLARRRLRGVTPALI